MVLQLLGPAISSETVAVLDYLLLEARAGRVVGIAYVVVHRCRGYSCNAVGEPRREPTFTRGMLHVLDDQLAALILDVRR